METNAQPVSSTLISETKSHGVFKNFPSRPVVDVEFSNISYSVPGMFWTKESKSLLKDVSGKFMAGQLTAVMGPSGSGKSTLLHILAGYKTSCGGEIMVNGAPRDMRRFRKLSCYIMQDSNLLPFLTVDEAMNGVANLKLGEKVPSDERQSVVQELLESLGLMDNRTTLTSQLSGGQRKRLCIAQELVSNPPIMFLDEPISGLDSSSGLHCVSLLKSLAQSGRTVVCSIHQPSARLLEMFDHLYILTDGHCVYRGSVPGLVPFVSGATGLQCPLYHNPADFAMEVVCGEYGNDAVPQLVRSVSTSEHRSPSSNVHDYKMKCSVVTEETAFAASTWTQFRVILQRSLISNFRNPTLNRVQLSTHIMCGLLFGLFFYNIGNDASSSMTNVILIYMCSILLAFAAMMPMCLTFPLENAVFVKEHFNSYYTLKSYFWAKSITDIPAVTVFAITFLLLTYFLTGQSTELPRLYEFLLIGILTSLNANGLGLFFGAVAPLPHALILSVLVSMPIGLFAGFLVNYSVMPVWLRWISDISYMRYSFNGFLAAIYGNERPNLDCDEIYCHFRSPKLLLTVFEVSEAKVWVCAMVLVAHCFVLRILTYFAMWFSIIRRRRF